MEELEELHREADLEFDHRPARSRCMPHSIQLAAMKARRLRAQLRVNPLIVSPACRKLGNYWRVWSR
jgi:hypothetical protein